MFLMFPPQYAAPQIVRTTYVTRTPHFPRPNPTPQDKDRHPRIYIDGTIFFRPCVIYNIDKHAELARAALFPPPNSCEFVSHESIDGVGLRGTTAVETPHANATRTPNEQHSERVRRVAQRPCSPHITRLAPSPICYKCTSDPGLSKPLSSRLPSLPERMILVVSTCTTRLVPWERKLCCTC